MKHCQSQYMLRSCQICEPGSIKYDFECFHLEYTLNDIKCPSPLIMDPVTFDCFDPGFCAIDNCAICRDSNCILCKEKYKKTNSNECEFDILWIEGCKDYNKLE